MIAQARRAARFIKVLPLCLLAGAAAQAAPSQSFPQVEASSQEQYILELVNEARSNPTAEGERLASVTDSTILAYYSHYGVNPNTLRSDFARIAAQPPLAFNAKLMASSRQQSLDQASHGFQGHDGSDGSRFDARITGQGYKWSALGENVFAYVQNPFFGHVGLNSDWGVSDLDHRRNIMNTDPNFPVYKEIGISVVNTSVQGFGPLVLTQDFGVPSDSSVAYVVGVVYNDLNGNGSYDEGEGAAGVTVTPSTGDYYAVTTSTGGYMLPLPAGAGSMQITASGGGLGASRLKTINYADSKNVRVNFTNSDPAGPALPSVTIAATAGKALVDGSKPGLITVTRKGAKKQAIEIALNVGGTAVSGVDYEALPATVTIPAGQTSVTLTVNPLNATFTGVKKVKVQPAPGANYTVTKGAKANIRILAAN